MQKWRVEFTTEAEKDFASLEKSARRRILEKLEWFSENFSGIFPTFLTGEYRNYFKLRVGDYRIFYNVAWEKYMLIIRYIDHRSKAYKKKRK